VEPSGAPWRVLETTEPEQARPLDPPHGPHRAVIAATVIAVVVAALAVLVVMRSAGDVAIDGAGIMEAGFDGQGGTASANPAAASPVLVIEVTGAVRDPGVYRLPGGSRVGDAITAAGGYAGSVDASLADRQLNLAALIRDGDEIRVPARGDSPATVSTGAGSGGADAGASAAGDPVDLNHATVEQLDGLPGVGPATAAKIIAARAERPFASVDELRARKVVGAATLEKIRPLATVSP
jgi:competence protein ComEA